MKNDKEVKTELLSFRVTPEMKIRLKAMAKREFRTIGQTIEMFIHQGLERHKESKNETKM